MMERIESL